MDCENHLKDKLKRHYEVKKNGFIVSVYTLNRIGPIIYFVVSLGILYWGITEALPYLYEEDSHLFIAQVIGWIIMLEMVINWICIRYVDSTYVPNVHGTKPSPKHISSTKLDIEKEQSVEDGNILKDKPSSRRKIFKMLVAVSMPNEDGIVERVPYDYWSWAPCVVCNRLRPPRCHHCVLCKRCVLKRDHHCFFSGSCVGVNNQRYFIVFLFWTVVGCVFSSAHMIPYVWSEILSYASYPDLLPPVTFIRALFGCQTYLLVVLSSLGWSLAYFTVFSCIHLIDSFWFIISSSTSFEVSNGIKVTDVRTNQERLRSVFGNYWLLNFILPCHFIFKPREDPALWPTLKS